LTNSRDNLLKLIDIRTFEVIKTLESDEYFCSNNTNNASISPMGRYACVGSKNGKLITFDLNKGEVEEICSEHTTSIMGCAW
jgi:autophagy-related protein 16